MLYRIVVLGDGGTGKTALTLRFCLSHFVETYDPTIEDSYKKQMNVDGTNCTIEVLDTAGQEEYKSLHNQWIMDGDGFVVVFSLTMASTLASVSRIHDQILMVKDTSRAPIVIVGNKCDLQDERQVSTQEISALARSLGCEYLETSAKVPINVDKAFLTVVRMIRQERELSFGDVPVKQGKSCCVLM